ncbi:hypothetical protein C8N24_0665 [Solirubrobacter pauli]|uniref:Uncharacterized protein n=1 Tax=Solirubrobacter pauli TaxID=166793 RepID=A0A660LA58_9ACTN|nr:hypothetical protein [Solirubrobacter pauli]RKQ90850.1 hypothetical protein C8N24_0665 [Solirubrobacter pauli]
MDGKMPDLWPPGTLERINDVTHFVADHLVTQRQLDLVEDRDLAQWIALISGHVGRPAELVARVPTDADALRGAVVWLACASADTVRAKADFDGTDLFAELNELGGQIAGVLLHERPRRPTAQVLTVVHALGTLIDYAQPLLHAPGEGGATSFTRGVLEALKAERPELATRPADEADDDYDLVEDVSYELHHLAGIAGTAAVVLHPGGVVSMPEALDE